MCLAFFLMISQFIISGAMTPKLLPKVSTKEEFGIFKQDLSNSPEPIVFIREN